MTPLRKPTGAAADAMHELLADLAASGLPVAEVYRKQGRSRRLELRDEEVVAASSQEQGWAVRAGSTAGSFLRVGDGERLPLGSWPSPAGLPLELPRPQPVPAFAAPADLDAPLLSADEGAALLAAVARELAAELPRARLVRAVLDDGASESTLVNSHGLRAAWRGRVAALLLEAVSPATATAPAAFTRLYLAAREARRLAPLALARRLADRLATGAAPARAGERITADLVLDPSVGVVVLTALVPLLVGAGAAARRAASGLETEDGRLASPAVSILDDGRLPGGLFAAAVDGEGVPTRRLPLVEQGRVVASLLDWREARARPGAPSTGCVRRPSYRDPPRRGPTHLFVRPQAETTVGDLLAAVRRGAYLLEPLGGVEVDLGGDRVSLVGRGFEIVGGRAVAPRPEVRIAGSLRALLGAVVGVGRDLTFFPGDGMLGIPTLLLHDVEMVLA